MKILILKFAIPMPILFNSTLVPSGYGWLCQVVMGESTVISIVINNGSCTILQNLLHQQLFWLTSRYHILELIVGAAFTRTLELPLDPKWLHSKSWKPLEKAWTLDTDSYLRYLHTSYERPKASWASSLTTDLKMHSTYPEVTTRNFSSLLRWSLEDTLRGKGLQLHNPKSRSRLPCQMNVHISPQDGYNTNFLRFIGLWRRNSHKWPCSSS